MAMGRCRAARLAWGVALTFAWKMLKIGSPAGSSPANMVANPPENSAKNSWMVLAVWDSAESARRCNFHQDTSSGPWGPHSVSEGLGRCVSIDLFAGRKLAIGGLICKACPDSARHRFCLPLPIVSGPRSRLAAFLHWKPYFCQCLGPVESCCIAVPCRALKDYLAASGLHGDWGWQPATSSPGLITPPCV